MCEITFDIETIPSQKPGAFEDVLRTIKPPSTITKPESISKWIEEKSESEAQKVYRKQALDGLYGEIISIAWMINDDEPMVVFRTDENESLLLRQFFDRLTGMSDKYGQRIGVTKWIGHYITGFDLRFLWQRCVINSVKPPIQIPYDAKPWDDRIFDTKIAWTGATNGGAGSMDAISKALGYGGKTDMDGSKVYDAWLAGQYNKIAEYNMDDVIKTRQIYKRMTFS